MTPDRLTLEGLDNYGKPRQDFADKLAAADEAGYLAIAEQSIWLSAYATSNPHSDYHWEADACYAESIRRGDVRLYNRAWEKAAGS